MAESVRSSMGNNLRSGLGDPVPKVARLDLPPRRLFSMLLALAAILLLAWTVPTQAQEPSPQGTVPGSSHRVFLPAVLRGLDSAQSGGQCPTTSSRSYTPIPVDGPPADHPDELHGDLNLALRGYQATSAALGIVDINGGSDPNAPQMPGLFADQRTPAFTSVHRVYDWDWSCGEHGCRSSNLTPREVTLLGMGVTPGEAISFPSRGPQIYGGGYIVLVLYASEERITLGYTRRDSVAPGYAVHIEEICVDVNLLALYRRMNQAGRGQLPALRNGEILGTAKGSEIRVAVRDRGSFMDPRSRKDWWKGR